ncbi:HNH endonuclease [Myceligenerans crystallogenes]|uniref:HNH endonuclease n=1 Tax=Myceligenerans crystallogenes TaxID=316335 RepID=UPI0031D49D1B
MTDNAWAAFLRARTDLDVVNFWKPTPAASFNAIQPGEPFLFKTHAPDNRLVGGGFLLSYRVLTVSEAWEFFGEGNGVASEAALRDAIVRHRRDKAEPVRTGEDPLIGCRILGGVFFAPDGRTLPAPSDFAMNIVSGKSYALTQGAEITRAFEMLLGTSTGVRLRDDDGAPTVVPGPVFRSTPDLVWSRAGQGAFRAAVTAAYRRTCALTGNRITPALEAAHIVPVSADGQNRVDNGLLMRSDVHRLFDLGYIGVDRAYRLHVSPTLREDTGNGEWFYARAGEQVLRLPERKADRPSGDALEWHMDTRFRRRAG